MSYRDLRNFTEMMRGLGYVRIISMENFRKPNFPLVAEVLVWLVKRYDPSSEMTLDIDSVQDRVMLIKSVVQFMSTKAHLKLSTKRLYQADGYAVKELLKVTSVLYNAIKAHSDSYHDRGDEGYASLSFDISSKLQDLKNARHLASEVTAKGASLYDVLNREVELREVRSAVISRQLELNDIEKKLKQCIKGVEEDIQKTRSAIDSVKADETTLEAKMEKKRLDLERNQKRLETLRSVRPAYMDEYDKLEEDLQRVYDDYLLKFRNMAYLEELLDEFEKAEQGRYEDLNTDLSELTKKTSHNKKEDDVERSSDGLLDNDNSEEENFNSRQHQSGPLQGFFQHSKDGLMVRGAMRMQDDIEDDEDDDGDDTDDDAEDDQDDDENDASDESSELVVEEGVGGIHVTKIIRPGLQRKSKWKQLEDDDEEDGF